jgi:P4 family phage/plasmid primase-like protien
MEDVDEFMATYKACIEQGLKLHLTERHASTSPFLIDLDFRQKDEVRLYMPKKINGFVKTLVELIRRYVAVDAVECYVMEKVGGLRPNKSGGFKDGVHVVLPGVVTSPAIQHRVRADFLAENADFFAPLGFTNALSDIYDKAVIDKSGWFMYGSCKPDEPHPWKAVCKLTIAPDGRVSEHYMGTSNADVGSLVDLFSIRNKFDEATYTEAGLTVINESVHANESASQVNHSPGSIVSLSASALDGTAVAATLSAVGRLVDALSDKRADDYNEWMRVGWCLHNIDRERLLDKWVEFSRRSSKFREGECARKWAAMKHAASGLKMGSLMMWARQDSPEAFNVIRGDMLDNLLTLSASGTHADIADVVWVLYRDSFVCASFRGNIWFEFDNHRWRQIENAYTLRQKLVKEVSVLYSTHADKLAALAQQCGDDAKKASLVKKAKALEGVALKLKNMAFKENIIAGCRELFYVRGFLDQLDSKPHLLGFDNGVYDLDADEFRDGRPDDMVSLSVGFDYDPVDKADLWTELMDFVDSTMPSPEMTTYLTTVLGYMLHGDKHLEQLWFFTGHNGRNGKGCLCTLLKKTFGDYYYEPDITIVTAAKRSSSNASPEVAKAVGKRLLVCSEPDDTDPNGKFRVNRLKQFRGNDVIQARALYKDTIEFRPQFGMIFQMNDKPELSKLDDAIAKTLKVVNFPYQFVDNPMFSHQKQKKYDLKSKFENDVPYRQQFMRLLLSARRCYMKEKKGPILEPDEVQRATDEYMNENNAVREWLWEHYDRTDSHADRVLVRDMFDRPPPRKKMVLHLYSCTRPPPLCGVCVRRGNVCASSVLVYPGAARTLHGPIIFWRSV